jgi:hypothetical protein
MYRNFKYLLIFKYLIQACVDGSIPSQEVLILSAELARSTTQKETLLLVAKCFFALGSDKEKVSAICFSI